jgi:hypothetical protein
MSEAKAGSQNGRKYDGIPALADSAAYMRAWRLESQEGGGAAGAEAAAAAAHAGAAQDRPGVQEDDFMYKCNVR